MARGVGASISMVGFKKEPQQRKEPRIFDLENGKVPFCIHRNAKWRCWSYWNMDKHGGFPAMLVSTRTFCSKKRKVQGCSWQCNLMQFTCFYWEQPACFCTYQVRQNGSATVSYWKMVHHWYPWDYQAWDAHRIYFPVAVCPPGN